MIYIFGIAALQPKPKCDILKKIVGLIPHSILKGRQQWTWIYFVSF